MKEERVGVIGSINVDLLLQVDRLPRPGHTVLGQGGTLSPGGKGANQALAAARQGVPTIMVGAVGSDANARVSTSLLREANVDLSHVAAFEGPTGMAVVSVDRAGENSIIVVPAANLMVNEAMVEAALSDLLSCAVVIVQCEIPAPTVDFTVSVLTGAGTRVILNLAPVIGVASDTLRLADPLIVNEHEAVEALGLLSAEIPAVSGDTVLLGRVLAEALLAAGVHSVVVTLGADGAIIAGDDAIEHIPSPTVEAVDTTGAGDAFVGTAAAGLARGLTLFQACTLAVRAASESVQAHGAQTSYPWKAAPHLTTLPH